MPTDAFFMHVLLNENVCHHINTHKKQKCTDTKVRLEQVWWFSTNREYYELLDTLDQILKI